MSEPQIENTADYIIRTMWSLLKRLNLDWGRTAMEFDSVDWSIREAVGINRLGEPINDPTKETGSNSSNM